MAVRDYEFDQFRLTPEVYELTRAGRPVRLEKIPFDLLVLLIERRPELVSREVITSALWGNGGFQDLDQSLNTAIRKVRLALRDSADEPRFIQTVVGRGYRFLPDVSVKERAVSPEPSVAEPPARRGEARHLVFRRLVLLAGLSGSVDRRLARPSDAARSRADRRAAVRGPERRSRTGVFQPGSDGGGDHAARPGGSHGLRGYRRTFGLALPRDADRSAKSRFRARGRIHRHGHDRARRYPCANLGAADSRP